MRRTPLALLILAATTFVPAAAHAAQAPERPPLAADVAACETGPEPAQRFAVFTASMPASKRTRRMDMRFELQVRRGRSMRWSRVRAPKWGRWERSRRARTSGFIYTKRITDLSQFATYRAVVRFRWFDKRGRIIRRAVRRTRVCTQPDLRPDLGVDAVRAGPPDEDGRREYRIVIRNLGATAAPASLVELRIGDRPPIRRDVARVAPRERVTVTVSARACSPGEQVVAEVDVRGQMDEVGEGPGNTRAVACPA